MGKITIATIINELTKIAHILEELDLDYEAREDQTLKGYSFDNCAQIIDVLEEQTHIMTHELSSDIQFKLHHLNLVLKYAQFRQKYQHWNSQHLQAIIDGETAMHVLKQYIKQQSVQSDTERRRLSQEIKRIRQEWNEQFGNQNYQQVMNKIEG